MEHFDSFGSFLLELMRRFSLHTEKDIYLWFNGSIFPVQEWESELFKVPFGAFFFDPSESFVGVLWSF